MSETPAKWRVYLARTVWILVIFLVITGLIEFSHSPGERRALIRDILARPGGPMTFRFILQPAMATITAFRDARRDVRMGRSPYLRGIVINRRERTGRLYEGLISTAQIILLGLVMDAIYQAIVLKTFHAGQAVIIAVVLAFLPYVLLRGPIARIVRWRRDKALAKVDSTTKGQDDDR
jgi:hypothetical protein